ncbi:MAG: hypothetical protein CENE_01984 [Candidatus Celerinatantimonas neptuna]|nr:MAG: hypothetical protein CENE_01984 [Candidatus Celerinatantimonas neptuna]
MISPELEKRSFIRMKVESPVQIYFDEKAHQGICHDLSATGMGVILKEEPHLKAGDPVSVELKPGKPGVHAFIAKGRIVHIHREPDGVLVGLQFSKIM